MNHEQSLLSISLTILAPSSWDFGSFRGLMGQTHPPPLEAFGRSHFTYRRRHGY